MSDEQTTETPENPNEISVKSNKTDREVTFERDFGSTLEQATEMFGADVVLNLFKQQAVIRAQAAARSVLDNPEKSVEDAAEAGANYVPGAKRVGGGGRKKTDPIAALKAQVASGEITAEEMIEKLRAELAGVEE